MKAVFTTKQTSAYDDVPEIRYHFPKTYLRQVENAVGDLVVYYEPRRTSIDDASRGGRQAYFALAKLERIESDALAGDHYYAYVTEYVGFDSPVPFRLEGKAFETGLQKQDGSTNRGAFGRAVRLISEQDFSLICAAGFLHSNDDLSPEARVDMPTGFEDLSDGFERERAEVTITRALRERAFTRQVQAAYQQRCAVTGLRLINGGGRPEAQAAHIKPVEANGPDSVRNGIALSGTAHWMFDRGLISVGDDYKILKAGKLLAADDAERLVNPSGGLLVPGPEYLRPHPHFLRYHRDNVFKG